MNWFTSLITGDRAHERALEIAEDLVEARIETALAEIEARSNTFTPKRNSEAEITAALGSGSGISASTKEVTWQSTLGVSAALACSRLLAQGLAQPSCKILKVDQSGKREEQTDHPLFDVLSFSPNPDQTAYEFRETIGLHLALAQNAFVRIVRSGSRIVALWVIKPNDVTVTQNPDRTLTYDVAGEGRLTSKDVWHIRGLSWNGYEGEETIKMARESIGLAIATEAYGSALFRNGARPAGILSIAGRPTKEQLDNAATSFNSKYSGIENAHKTAVIGAETATYTAIAGTANEAQWTEARRHQIEEICRAFGVRPSMVYTTGATSYASVEQEFLAHVKFTLSPWHERFEQSAAMALLTPAERKSGLRIKLNTNALLRGSVAERMATYQTLVPLGAMTVNEVRKNEDLPTFDFPEADLPNQAANVFGSPKEEPASPEADQQDEETPPATEDPMDDEVSE
jgi:HK97 family phage portal protein